MNQPAPLEYSPLAAYLPPDRWRDAFAEWMRNLTNPRTRREYHYDWRQFLDTVRLPADEITSYIIKSYRDELTAREFSNSSISRKLTSLSSFYAYAVEIGLLEENPVRGVKRPPVRKYGKAKYLTGDEDKRLLAVFDRNTIKGKRNYAMILFMLTTAVRSKVVETLRLAQIYDFRGDVFIPMTYVNKGGKSRTMTLPDAVKDALADYLRTREALTPESFVFASLHSDGGLSNSNISRVLRLALKEAGLNTTLSPHSLRHTAARNAEKDGKTIGEVMSLTGHSDPGTAMIYLQTLITDGGDVAADLARRYE